MALSAVADDEERTQQALEHYRRALQIRPDFAEAHSNLGIALTSRGNLDEAMSHFQYAVHLEPQNAEFQQNLKQTKALRASVVEE